MAERPIIVLIESNRLIREAFRAILEDSPYAVHAIASRLHEVTGQLPEDARVVIWIVDTSDPALAKSDLNAARDLRLLRPELGQIAIAQSTQDSALAAAIEAAGIDALLSKDISVEDLISAIHLVTLGQRILVTRPSQELGAAASQREQPAQSDPHRQNHIGQSEQSAQWPMAGDDQGHLSHGLAQRRERRGAIEIKLTEREVEIMRHLVAGLSNKDIAHQMGLSEATVKAHIKVLLRKIGVNNRTQAAVWALSYHGGAFLDS